MKYSMGKSNGYYGYDIEPRFEGDENQYLQNKKEKATPYSLSYLAAWKQRPKYEDPFIPVEPIVGEAKRKPILILISVLMVLVIAFCVVGYLALIPDYTALFKKVAETEDGVDVSIGIDDVINSTVKKLTGSEIGDEDATLYFYNECLDNIDSVDTAHLIAYYALPVSLVVTLLIAVYIFIKAVASACQAMKRRKFAYIILLQFLFSLVGVVSGFVWGGVKAEEFADYLFGGGITALVLGFGYFIILAYEIVALVLSFFAYKPKKKMMEEAQAKADAINRKRRQIYDLKMKGYQVIVGED